MQSSPATSARPATDERIERHEIESNIVVRFEAVAARRGAQVALTGNGRRWTYAELDRRVNQIARAIAGRVTTGVGCVAYLVDHSPEMVVCALAVLKAGKAYLCVHPGLPAAARRDVVNDAAPQLILTDRAHEAAAREMAGEGVAVLVLEHVSARDVSDAPNLTINPGDPAAIFYTSGSTGRPKGVVKSHRTVLHRAWLSARYDAVGPDDRQSLLTYCSFASSEADVFGALLNGASVHLYDVGALGLSGFGRWIDDEGITLLHPPVVLFRRYLSILDGREVEHPSVRLVMLAGEAVTTGDVEQWRRRFGPACGLRHRFSSSEAGHVAVGCVEPGEHLPHGALPAVRAVADKHLDVVDGELVVRSAFLSDGYWRREPAGDFFTDPAHPGERCFRTGDLGRINGDGSFEFLGRRDEQAKVRGYRVELREVEAALRRLTGVKETAVITERWEDETRLVAFVATAPGAAFDAEGIRAALRSTLPQWKIPGRIHNVDTLPLTLTGKVDRPLLQKWAADAKQTRVADPVERVAQISDPIAAEIAAIWEAVLDRKDVGVDDNFFDQGGDSLMAVRLMHRIGQRFGRSFPLTVLIQNATVNGLADAVRSPAGAGAVSDGVVLLTEGGSGAPLFCAPAAHGSALTYLPLARLLTGGQPVYGLQFSENDPADGEGASVEAMAARFIERVRRVRPLGPYRLCGHSYGGVLAFEMARQLLACGERVALLALFDAIVPGSQRRLPLCRRLPLHARRLATLGPARAIKEIAHRLGGRHDGRAGPRQRAEGAPDGGGEKRRQDARIRAFRGYRPLPYPGVITLFRAAVPFDWARFNVPQPFNGWDAVCGHVDVRAIPGDHLAVLREPALAALAAALNHHFAQAEGDL